MATKALHTQRNDGGKANGLKEESDIEHTHADIPALGDGRCDEDHDH